MQNDTKARSRFVVRLYINTLTIKIINLCLYGVWIFVKCLHTN